MIECASPTKLVKSKYALNLPSINSFNKMPSVKDSNTEFTQRDAIPGQLPACLSQSKAWPHLSASQEPILQAMANYGTEELLQNFLEDNRATKLVQSLRKKSSTFDVDNPESHISPQKLNPLCASKLTEMGKLFESRINTDSLHQSKLKTKKLRYQFLSYKREIKIRGNLEMNSPERKLLKNKSLLGQSDCILHQKNDHQRKRKSSQKLFWRQSIKTEPTQLNKTQNDHSNTLDSSYKSETPFQSIRINLHSSQLNFQHPYSPLKHVLPKQQMPHSRLAHLDELELKRPINSHPQPASLEPILKALAGFDQASRDELHQDAMHIQLQKNQQQKYLIAYEKVRRRCTAQLITQRKREECSQRDLIKSVEDKIRQIVDRRPIKIDSRRMKAKLTALEKKQEAKQSLLRHFAKLNMKVTNMSGG